MNIASLIAIYMPIFIVFFIVLPQQRTLRKLITIKRKKSKGVKSMTNDILKKFIGKNCSISTGTFGTSLTGKIVDINENWIEVETKKGIEIVNGEFVQSIKIAKA